MSGAEAQRLFIALWPDPATRAALARVRDALPPGPAAQPVRDDKLHLTLHFLGPQPARRIPALQAMLASPQAQHADMPIVLDRLETWNPGLVVLAAAQPLPALATLHASMAARLRALGLPVEARPHRPHVTLARRMPPGLSLPVVQPPLRWHPAPPVLVASRPDGSYDVLSAAC